MYYLEREYRLRHRQEDLIHFRVVVKETDLDVGVRKESFNEELVRLVEKMIREYRDQIEGYIVKDPSFLKSLSPCKLKPGAPPMAVTMAEAAKAAGVGPMAAVAGAMSEAVGRNLLRRSRDVIVENGGDIYLRSRRKRTIGIFAGQSVFSHRIALEINPEDTPIGICTSSGTIGHSLSYGCADAVVIVSSSAPLADAVATSTGNMVRSYTDLEQAVDFAVSIPDIIGAVAIKEDKLAAKGNIKLVPIK